MLTVLSEEAQVTSVKAIKWKQEPLLLEFLFSNINNLVMLSSDIY